MPQGHPGTPFESQGPSESGPFRTFVNMSSGQPFNLQDSPPGTGFELHRQPNYVNLQEAVRLSMSSISQPTGEQERGRHPSLGSSRQRTEGVGRSAAPQKPAPTYSQNLRYGEDTITAEQYDMAHLPAYTPKITRAAASSPTYPSGTLSVLWDTPSSITVPSVARSANGSQPVNPRTALLLREAQIRRLQNEEPDFIRRMRDRTTDLEAQNQVSQARESRRKLCLDSCKAILYLLVLLGLMGLGVYQCVKATRPSQDSAHD